MTIRNHPDYAPGYKRVHRVFSPNVPTDAGADAREDFYLQVLDRLGVLNSKHFLADLGAGFSRFAPLARTMGMRVAIVDDFGGGGGVDRDKAQETAVVLARLREELGVSVFESDFLSEPLPFEDQSVDVLTCFHSLEHWHHSPKKLFLEINRVLRPGGYIFFATPNAVNLRKRIWVLLGKSNYPRLEDWYSQEPVWRGHVREPVLNDLHRLFAWNGFEVIASYGRNFYGRDSRSLSRIPKGFRHFLVDAVNHFTQLFPSFCSDIHVVGRKSTR